MKKPKIVVILGSPRPQGNSAILAQKFLDAARELGAETKVYQLNQLDFQGCQGCGTCKIDTENCVLEDDLAPVLEAIKGADLLVLASPVYFGDISGQLKCFFDRTYSYAKPDFSSRVPAGKKAVVVLVQAVPGLLRVRIPRGVGVVAVPGGLGVPVAVVVAVGRPPTGPSVCRDDLYFITNLSRPTRFFFG